MKNSGKKKITTLPGSRLSYLSVIILFFFILSACIFYFFIIYSSELNTIDAITGYNQVYLNPEEKKWISDNPVISVCPDTNYPPFEMISLDGEYEGISADLLREICKNTGLTLNVIHDPDWSSCVDRIKRGEAEILGAIYISPMRSDYLTYSDPYYHSLLPIITRDVSYTDLTLEQLSGKRVASVTGYTTTLLLKEYYPGIMIHEVPDIRTGLEHVSLGTVDAYFGDLAASSWYVDKEGFSNLHIAGEYKPEKPEEFSYAFGIRKDCPELVQILNKGLHAITPEKREEIFKKWISPSLRKPSINPFYVMITAGFIGVLLLISLLFVVWNYTLKKVVEEKTRVLSCELVEHKKTTDRLMMTRQAVDHSKAMILWLDDTGIILDVNETTCYNTGLSPADLIGKHLTVLKPQYTQDQIDKILLRIQEEGYFQIETFVTMREGREIPVEVFVWHFLFEESGIFCLEIQDISERKRYEEERKTAIDQIQKNMAELSVLNDGIRNPLTVILGISESYCPEKFDVIENHVRQIDDTINQLDKRWMESGKILNYLKKHYGIQIKKE
ncbi:MAG: transporter substrate-binding domain-containing protein [Methanomicrobiales archaeon]|nr:transporter substrate-binding domain-containing protein [Methanomicrobiales archaeon]